MHNTLESHKLFPYVAWTLVIGFAVFTYALTMQVQGELADISDGVDRLEMKLDNLEKAQEYQ
jgi:cell division protein FtsL